MCHHECLSACQQSSWLAVHWIDAGLPMCAGNMYYVFVSVCWYWENTSRCGKFMIPSCGGSSGWTCVSPKSDWNRNKIYFFKLLQSLIDYCGNFTDTNAEWYIIVDRFFRNPALFTATKIRIASQTAMDVNDMFIPFVPLGDPDIFLFFWLMMPFSGQLCWRKGLSDRSE